jgi:cellulose synthase/poly-beta-1,6-N-acetylglucosamine synthase-like glycosyltransferase
VLIPAYNEAAVIAKTLTSLAACRPAPDEVVVVDDGSTDATAAVAQSYRSDLPQLTVIIQSNRGKAGALNTAIAATSAELLVVIDADTVISPHTLGELTAPFADPTVGAVAGNLKVGNRRYPLTALQAVEYVTTLNVDRRAQELFGTITVVPGPAGAFRRAALDQVGGYSADTMVEDADLTQTLLQARWRIHYAAGALVHTEAPQTLRDVVRQRRRWSYGTIQVAAKHTANLFDHRCGRAGLLALPWLVATQLLLPVFGPLADLWAIWSLANGQLGIVTFTLLVAIVLDLGLTAAAVVIDRERWTLVALIPAVHLIWRPLLLVVVTRSAATWLSGRTQTWHKITRYASVDFFPKPITTDDSAPTGATTVTRTTAPRPPRDSLPS